MRLCLVTVSVDTGDQLALTLPSNAAAVDDRCIVVTTSTDRQSQEASAGVECVVSDDCYGDGHAFNKGRMLTAGLQRFAEGINPADWWVLFTDADCFVPPDLRKHLSKCQSGHLYYGSRRHVPSDTDGYKPERMTDHHLADPVGNDGPWGYFQLVHAGDLLSRTGGGCLPTCFISAGGIDHWILTRWDRRIEIPVTVLHLWHGPLADRWNNGRSGHGVWTHAGQSFTGEATLAKGWPLPCHVRRTHLETCEQETVWLQSGLPAWRSPTRHGAPYEYAVRS